MEEKIEVPVRPVNREEQYLAAILGELQAIRAMLAPPVAEAKDDLFGDEVPLMEPCISQGGNVTLPPLHRSCYPPGAKKLS